jgi:tripartite-type tricarboxylate transporter receptor subunit TctC
MKRVVWLLLWIVLPDADVGAQNSHYQGKTLTIIVGSAPGVAYDIYARLVGQFIGKYLPGNPNVIVQNMPAAGSLVAANYVFGIAKPDGLTIASINPALYFNQLQGQREVKYDWAKFTWIGSTDKSEHLMYMRTCARIRRTKRCRTCGKARSRPNAAPRQQARAVTTFPGC